MVIVYVKRILLDSKNILKFLSRKTSRRFFFVKKTKKKQKTGFLHHNAVTRDVNFFKCNLY